MEDDFFRDVFAELSVIFRQMQPENVECIPKSLIKLVEKEKNKNYKVDTSIYLLDNLEKLKIETRILLSIIYRNYFKNRE